MEQTTNTILMVKPTTSFRSNEQTLSSNYYQKETIEKSASNNLQSAAEKEFDTYVEKLKAIGVNVIVFTANDGLDTPDSHFPNNWITFHENGDVGLYPMFAANRRLERREAVLGVIEKAGFFIKNIIDYRTAEEEGFFLEGTGSLILDRTNRKAYCALSPRANEELFIEFCEDFEYTPVIFKAYQTVDGKRKEIYHTNVMMSIGETFAVVCLECIDNKKERNMVIANLKADGKEIIRINENQVAHFAGNMLQVRGHKNELYLIMSETAYHSLSQAQLNIIRKHCKILSSPLETIEACGGGSARCMMAEIFLPAN